MKTFSELCILMAIVLISLAGCSDNVENGTTTVEEDKVNIRASFDRVNNLLQNFRNGNFYKFAEEFLGAGTHDNFYYWWVGEGNGDYSWIDGDWVYTPGQGEFTRELYGVYYGFVIPEFTRLLGDRIGDLVNFNDIGDNNRFRMAAFAGDYTWNNSQRRWEKTSRNDIRARFPSRENGSQNCELGITQYTDQKCDIEGTEIYLPTKVSAYFNKDGVKISSVEATASYNNYGIPKMVSASVYAKPITLATTLSQTTASRYSATLSVSDETESKNSLSVSGEATFSKSIDNYSSFTDLEINNLKFTLQQFDLKVEGSIDFKTYNSINNPSVTDINACINLEVFWKNKKTGTLRVEEVGGNRYLFIVYSDGTKENTSIYYDGFITDVENIFKNK